MPSRLPRFVVGAGVDSRAEFVAFQASATEPAAKAYALLTAIGTFGLDYIPSSRHVGPEGLYCLQTEGWGVFYTARGSRAGTSEVTILAVCRLGAEDYNALVSEAQRRMAVLEHHLQER